MARIPRGVVRLDDDRGVENQPSGLDLANSLSGNISWNVLRQDGNSASAGGGFGHPAPGDGRHIGHHNRNGCAGAIISGQIDTHARADG